MMSGWWSLWWILGQGASVLVSRGWGGLFSLFQGPTQRPDPPWDRLLSASVYTSTTLFNEASHHGRGERPMKHLSGLKSTENLQQVFNSWRRILIIDSFNCKAQSGRAVVDGWIAVSPLTSPRWSPGSRSRWSLLLSHPSAAGNDKRKIWRKFSFY